MNQTLQQLLEQFVECRLEAKLEQLPPEVQQALPDLAAAMRGMNRLFQRQIGDHVVQLAQQLEDEKKLDSPEGRAFLHFNGPYNKLQEGQPFLPHVEPAPPGRALYPTDLTREQLKAYLEAHAEQKDDLLSPYTAVVRQGEQLVAVPYHEQYTEELAPVAQALRAASCRLEKNFPPLASFLEGRALALLGQKSFTESDAEWVRLRLPPLEVVIGPFEQYEDHLMGVKAFYEGMLLAVDHERCQTLAAIEEALPQLAQQIPCPADSKAAVGGMAPMIVADQLLATGDGYAGILASAFNLPNDPVVRGEVGWKQIMIRNVMQAKFEHCTRPIAQRVLTAEDHAQASFDGYFYTVLLHEVTHGLGPAYRANGRPVGESCGPYATTLEEAKADVGALVLLLTHNGQHGIPALTPQQIGASLAAGLFRSARFGLYEAHGRANVIQYTFYKEQGALENTADGKLHSIADRLLPAAQQLLEQVTTLQAAADDHQLSQFLEKYGTPPPDLLAGVEALGDLPIDIRPIFPL